MSKYGNGITFAWPRKKMKKVFDALRGMFTLALEVATAALSPGEVILRERPLLGLPDSFDTDLDLLLNQTSLSHWDVVNSQLFHQMSSDVLQHS